VGARTYYQVDAGRGASWDIPNNDLGTVHHAIAERVFFVKKNGKFQRPPRPISEDFVMQRLAGFDRKMDRFASEFPLASPMTTDEFVGSYGGAKRKVYQAAADSLNDRKFSSRDARVKCFTKDEYMKPGGAPRAIQPRSPRFNVLLGRYLKPIEHRVFQCIDLIFDPSGEHRTVAKGMNMIDRGRTIAKMWNKHSQPVALLVDASRFDQHINQPLLKFEHKQYPKFVEGRAPDAPSLRRLTSLQLQNEGRYRGKDGKIKYKVRGNRMSGDMNTSLGNVIVMCSLMYAYIEDRGLLSQVDLYNDGDDCALIMDRRNLDRFRTGFEEWFEEMGITMCYDGVYDTLEEIEFCQAHPVYNEEVGYMLVPRPSKRLYSDLVSTKPLHSKKVYRKWMGAIAGCGLAASRGVPIFGEFYRWVGSGTIPYIPKQGDTYYRYRQELVEGMELSQREPTIQERISFYFAFNITPDEQVMMESYFKHKESPCWGEPCIDQRRELDPIQWLVPPEQKEHN
jgi:hypothetical protein